MVEEVNEDTAESVSSLDAHQSPPVSPTVQVRAQPILDTSSMDRHDEGTVHIVQVVPPPAAMRRHRRCMLRGACCCLTLQQGAIVIGGFQVAVITLHLLMEILYLAGVLLAGNYALNDDLTGNLPGDEERWGSMDIAYASISGVILFQELIALLFAGLLLHGARKRLPGFVRAWLIFTGFLLAMDFGLWAARLTLEFMYYPTRGGILVIRAFLTLCTPVYFLLVVRSFYYEILDGVEDLERGAIVAAPLLYKAASRDLPPPYTPSTPPYSQSPSRSTSNGGAGGGDTKRPLETDLDDVEAGFGAGWQQARAAEEISARQQLQQRGWREDSDEDEDEDEEQQQAGPLPYKGRPVLYADSEDGGGVQLRSHVRSYYEDDYDEVAEDEAEAELEAARRRASRRIVGAGRMVLPPLPPGARASLQHVPPPVSPSPPPSFRQPTLI